MISTKQVRQYAGTSTRFMGCLRSRSRSSHLRSIMLVMMMAAVFLLGYPYLVSDGQTNIADGQINIADGQTNIKDVNKTEGLISCTSELQIAIPVLRKVYGGSMKKVLHIGPYSCSVVAKLLEEENTEAWGVEPYGLADTSSYCRTLVRKGFVRVSDIKFPLPYRANSFSHVIVSDALEYLTSRHLNNTLPELLRVSSNGVIVFAGFPGSPILEHPIYGLPAKLRSRSWWKRYFVERKMVENGDANQKFQQASMESSYKPACQVFHLKPGPYQT